ncbi:MAG: hypothetical protein Q4C25_04260 [Bacillota bacterium]|nr:hypothetical protein [Bacillota bacterium]
MWYGILGIIAFVLYFLYDINSVRWKNRILNCSFFLGTAMLVIATAGIILVSRGDERLIPMADFGANLMTALVLALGLAFAALLVYTLFFAIPFEATYVKNMNNCPMVYKNGVYALCRHPGVLWFVGLFVCLGMEFSSTLVVSFGTLFCLLDVAYVIFQDRWTFMKTFEDYREYKTETPFLIPTKASIKKCLKSMKG